MSCPYYIGKTKRDFIKHFTDRNIVDKFGNVTDYANFHKEVNKWSRIAFNRYGKDYGIKESDRLLLIEDGSNGKKYVANSYIMEKIDKAKIDGWKRKGGNLFDDINDDGTDIDPNKKC